MTCRCRSGECDPECDGPKLRAEIARLQTLLNASESLKSGYLDENARLQTTITAWATARAAMNGVKINTPECAAAFEVLGAAEVALAALKDSAP